MVEHFMPWLPEPFKRQLSDELRHQSYLQDPLINPRLSRKLVAKPLLHPSNGADFEAWDRVQVLTLRQAAHLWSGERPADSMERPSQSTEVVLNELVDAAIASKLNTEPWPEESENETLIRGLVAIEDHNKLGVNNSTADHSSRTKVTRGNLLKYALGKGERPAFLFPEMR